MPCSIIPDKEDYEMPCDSRGGNGYSHYTSQIDKLEKQLSQREAMLCEVLTILKEQQTYITPFDLNVHWDAQRSGITYNDFEKWWFDHQEKDRIRLAAEEQVRIYKETKRKALEKLSYDEKKILGLLNH
jgi:hypothetical protein